jgi:signal transduction histidine kinase
MAMHKSEELAEVAALLFDQLKILGAQLWTAGFAICKKEEVLVEKWMSSPIPGQMFNHLFVPYNADHGEQRMYDTWKNQEALHSYAQGGKELKDIYDHLMEIPSFKANFQKVIDFGRPLPVWQKNHVAAYKYGYLLIITEEEFEEENIFPRFAKVFEQTYTRFLDLEKAEAQAREAQIEVALEKVRSASMAMHKSEELIQVVRILDKQILGLGIEAWGTQIITDFANPEKGANDWLAVEGQDYLKKFHIPFIKHPSFNKLWTAVQKGIEFYTETYSKADKDEFYKLVFKFSDFKSIPKERQNFAYNSPGKVRATVLSKNSILIFQRLDLKEFSKEEEEIFKRFGKVFEQAYVRFLDLQKAEAQAREAQIEAALEKVRSASMAMQKQEDLIEVINLLSEQLVKLGVQMEFANFSNGNLLSEWNLWIYTVTGDESAFTDYIHFPEVNHPIFIRAKECTQDFKNGKADFFKDVYDKEEKDTWLDYSLTKTVYKDLPSEAKDYLYNKPGLTRSIIFFKDTSVGIGRYNTIPFSDEEEELLKRFANAFNLAYTRFLDLQKAEAQARESQIQLALERVRARTMAMHKSDELAELNAVILKQVHDLNVEIFAAGVHIADPKAPFSETWIGDPNDGQMPKTVIDHSEDPLCDRMYQGWKVGERFKIEFLEGEELKNHFQNMGKMIPEQKIFEELVPPEKLYFHLAYFRYGFFVFTTMNPCPENHDIFIRFAKVFEQTYTRFLDLQKAEAQAREAQIEVALERVRARAMAMQKSHELRDVVNVMIQNLKDLGLEILMCEIVLFQNNFDSWKSWLYIHSEKELVDIYFEGPYFKHPFNTHQKEAFERGLKYTTYVLEGENKQHWDKLFDQHMNGPRISELKAIVFPIQRTVFSLAYLNQGAILVAGEAALSEEGAMILQKFAKVVDLTYTRVEDLHKAEKRALEAIKQSSLDRVRGEIASMRDAKDLERITPLVWKELQSLGVPFFRCGVMLVNEEDEFLDFYLSNPQGEALGALHLDFDNSEITRKGVAHWRKKETYIEHWNQEQFLTFMRSLLDQGQISNPTTYQGGEKPPTALTLQFVPFAQGMLYVGSEIDLNAEELDLVKALGKSLSVAYARYEDFTKLDLAKAKAEKALNDLKAAQEQLVQQEKLASLGQLTAGIAHEIKNPLNFVNNFSDLSRELIEEVFAELENLEASATKEEIIAILQDVQSNLTKVHEHGTRADSIVTSMLQHSRASGSKREPKAFNPLVKEFVNLSFHGMRAGKAPINVDIDLQLDPSVGEVAIISEDFSRVILNLCNNAFDAMRDKLKSGESVDYLPKLSVKTALQKDKVIFSIADNGSGIPDEIRDKILQPFFTTKKGTEGTGLGLSITNDIVKAHGGELKVESKEGEGTVFSIQLPLI